MSQLINTSPAVLNAIHNNDFSDLLKFLAEQTQEVNITLSFQENLIDLTSGSPNIIKFTPLSLAVYKNNLQAVSQLIELGADLTNIEIKRHSLLSWAIKHGYEKIAGLLIAKGHPLDKPDSTGIPPLTYAIAHNRVSVARELLEKEVTIGNKALLSISLPNYAIRQGYNEIAKILIDSKEKEVAQSSETDLKEIKQLYTALLFLAIEKEDLDQVKRLVAKGADVNTNDINHNSALGLAIAKEQPQIAKLLSDKGAQLNEHEKSNNPRKKFIAALIKGEIETLRESLIRHEFNLQEENSILKWIDVTQQRNTMVFLTDEIVNLNCHDLTGTTPLIAAIKAGKQTIVTSLLDKDADVTFKDSDGKSPLEHVDLEKHREIAEILINRGATLDNYKEKLLAIAVKKGDLDKVRSLRQEGVAIADKVPDHNFSPVEWAIIKATFNSLDSQNFQEIAKLLIDTAQELDPKWLILAINRGNLEIVTKLLAKGANVNSVDKDNHSALWIAIDKGEAQIAKLLSDRGAYLTEKEKSESSLESSKKRFIATLLRADIKELKQILEGKQFAPKEDLSILQWVDISASPDITQLLIANGAAVNCHDLTGTTLLIAAIKAGDEIKITSLLKNSVDVNFRDKKGGLPLQYVNIQLHPEIEKQLIAYGARLESLSSAHLQLIQAIKNNEIEKVKGLIKDKVDINFTDTISGLTPLNLAISKKFKEIALLLIDQGADLIFTENCRFSPLLQAIDFSMSSVVEAILAKGISPNATHQMPAHPLEYIVRIKETLQQKSTAQRDASNDKEILDEQNKIALLLLKAGANAENIDKKNYPQHAALFKIAALLMRLINNLNRKIAELEKSYSSQKTAQTEDISQTSQSSNGFSFFNGFRKYMPDVTGSVNRFIDERLLKFDPTFDINDLKLFRDNLSQKISELCTKIGSETELLTLRNTADTAEHNFMIITNIYENMKAKSNVGISVLITNFYNFYKQQEAVALDILSTSAPQSSSIHSPT